jgi:hypothetical protein
MRVWQILLLIAVCIALVYFLTKSKKERFTGQTMFLDAPRLRPVLRSRNDETMDVLAYSLGGLSAPSAKKC